MARDRPYFVFGRRYQLSVRLNVMDVLRRWTVVGFEKVLLTGVCVVTNSLLVTADCSCYCVRLNLVRRLTMVGCEKVLVTGDCVVTSIRIIV